MGVFDIKERGSKRAENDDQRRSLSLFVPVLLSLDGVLNLFSCFSDGFKKEEGEIEREKAISMDLLPKKRG